MSQRMHSSHTIHREELGNGELMSKARRRTSRLALFALLALAAALVTGCTSAKGDPGGIATGGAADVANIVDGGPAYALNDAKPTTDTTAAAHAKRSHPSPE